MSSSAHSRHVRGQHLTAAIALAALGAMPLARAAVPAQEHSLHRRNPYFHTHASTTQGSVEIGGRTIHYHAVAGMIVVHAAGWNDATGADGAGAAKTHVPPEAAMFYVAYFKNGADPSKRPITFLYNGGPGSASLWLHMGAFGPRRVLTAGHTQTPPAPYAVVNNRYSLLDASDLVFIDAPGTGFGRVRGPDPDQHFYGADADVHAFAQFIMKFLSKYGRWNSPKYLLGESYGTPRSAMLVNDLETRHNIDFNGVILLSAILNFDDSNGIGMARFNPGVDLPYELSLPSFTATAWYHHKLPGGEPPLRPLLAKVEHFAMTDYAQALRAGSLLSRTQFAAIAADLHRYTGLPTHYIEQANLRVTGGEFQHELLSASDQTTGRLDSRFAGPTLNPLGQRAQYDPQSTAISSAYVAAFNNYVRKVLHFGAGLRYKVIIPVWRIWNFSHRQPGGHGPLARALNVMPDLANAMKQDPDLKVMLNGGYFDLATPFYEGIYEMHHLPMPRKLQANIEYHYYMSGHMIYVHVPALKRLHANIVKFIDSTDHLD